MPTESQWLVQSKTPAHTFLIATGPFCTDCRTIADYQVDDIHTMPGLPPRRTV